MVNFTRLLRFPIQFIGDGGTLFDDHLKIYVRGGCGGRGLPLFGGVGGAGGDVYLEASPTAKLKIIKSKFPSRRFIAKDGRAASKILILGEKGKDLVVQVPMGITVETVDRKVLGELNKKNEKLLVAKGGEGGSPKSKFFGVKAVPHILHLHLKLIADIGFVGFPNAGKSTLLKALSRAKPKISSFPFTTVRPQIGMMEYDDFRKISLADLPGLIEGAHLNRGMGHQFLKHVERTMMLMFIVDIGGFQLSLDDKYRNAYETIILLNKELELYNPMLLDKPAILCVNKMDNDVRHYKFNELVEKVKTMKDDKEILDEFRPEKFMEFQDILPITAVDKQSTDDLKTKLRKFIDVIDDLKRRQVETLDDDLRNELTNPVPTKNFV